MSKKIAIIELDYHVECVNTLCKVFLDSPHSIIFYTKLDIYSELIKDKRFLQYEWRILRHKESVKDFILNFQDEINTCDVVFFDTLASNFKFFSEISFLPKTIVRIHNTNTYLNPLKNLWIKLSFFYLFKDFSHFFRETILNLDWYYRAKCIQKFDYLCFPDQTITDYVLQNKLTDASKVCQPIPLTVNDPIFFKSKPIDKEFYFTVPGSIDKRRKDYTVLYNAFKNAIPLFKTRVVLTLAGKPKGRYGDNIIKKFKELESDFFHLQTFENRVSQSQFNLVMKQTDCIIAPILKYAKYTLYKEVYGQTKISGSMSDIIQYGKPGIFPDTYPISIVYKDVIKQYTSVDDLTNLVLNQVSLRIGLSEEDFKPNSIENTLKSIEQAFFS